ncbi:MAG: hypothetical protein JWN44_960 [Myxococcales bacterium]|nr:hypothetical protein [Myxococcales bacterium]
MALKKDLGSILVDEDVLDAKALERVVAGNTGRRPLWAALVDADVANADQIFRAMAARFGVPVVSDDRLSEVQVPESLKRALTRGEALATGLLPVDLSADGQRATVVMVDPSDERTLAEFLTRARVPEGRALLARREALMRATERCFGDATAVVTPLPPQQRRGSGPSRPPTLPPMTQPQPPVMPSQAGAFSTGGAAKAGLTPPHGAQRLEARDDDVTGTVKLDPSLQAEIQRLPARMSQADALTPLPRPRPKRPTPHTAAPPIPPPQPPPPSPTASSHASPSSGAAADEPHKSAETQSEALRAEERLTRALIESVEVLASELEARVVGGAGGGAEMARLARRVARQLGLARRAADEIGVAAQLYALDRVIRSVEGPHSADMFADLGWAAAGDGGLLQILRSLTAASSGFGRSGPAGATPAVPIGARIIGAVADYQELGAAATAAPDLDTVSQLLRASPAGAQVVDALLRVLESDRGDKTPATPTTLPATSMLREKPESEDLSMQFDDDDDQPTPQPILTNDDSEKTQRKPYPRKEGTKGE